MTNFESSTRSLVAAAAVFGAAVILLVASACTESKSEKDASQYADSLCTSISGWETHITGIASRLDTGSPGGSHARQAERSRSFDRGPRQPDPRARRAERGRRRLEHLVTEGRTTVSDLEAIKGPFQDAVKTSKACQALKPSDDEQ